MNTFSRKNGKIQNKLLVPCNSAFSAKLFEACFLLRYVISQKCWLKNSNYFCKIIRIKLFTKLVPHVPLPSPFYLKNSWLFWNSFLNKKQHVSRLYCCKFDAVQKISLDTFVNWNCPIIFLTVSLPLPEEWGTKFSNLGIIFCNFWWRRRANGESL